MDSNFLEFEFLDVVFEDDKIIFVGHDYDGLYDNLIDATGKVVMPGLINCHTHLGMSLFRCSNDDYALNDWLSNYIWPIEDKMTDDDFYYTTLLTCIEMIKTGCTCFNDMYFGNRNMDAIIKSGLRGVYTRCLMGNLEDGKYRIDEFMDLYNKYKDNKLIKFSVAPHSLYTCDLDYLSECSKLATELNLPVHIHFSENMKEVDDVTYRYGMKPGFVLEKTGLLNNKLILAHGTFISDEELDLFSGHDVSICTNPVSNLNLGCGIADLVKYSKMGLNVCLGTDGQGSGNNMNMFYHMSLVDYLQKGKYQDSTVMSSNDVLAMATVNGARALGYDNLGSIKVGNLADIIILDLSSILVNPVVDLVNLIVHNCYGDIVDTTIINGNILMKNRKLLIDVSEADLISKVDEIRSKYLINEK
jgi:5-methylthioadenosine/S-adenosylhomocysteine deaminase